VLTGRTVFEGENSMAVAHKQIYEPAPHPRSLRPEIPAGVETLVLRCLQKDPTARYQSATEVKAALTQVINQLAQEETVIIPAPPASDATMVYRKPQAGIPPQRPRQPARAAAPVGAGAMAVPPPDESVVQTRGGSAGWVIAVLFVILAAAVSYGAFWLYGNKQAPPPPTIKMPGLLELDEATAQLVLKENNLIAQRNEESHPTIAKGKVCRQVPAEGTEIDPKNPVRYWISLGSLTYTMPDVGSMSLNRAKEYIREAAGDDEKKIVFVTNKKEDSESVPKGFIIRTNPAMGEQVKRNVKVTLIISNGPKPVNLIDETYHPGKATSINLEDPTVYIKIEIENPAGSEPRTLVANTFKPGDDIPDQPFQRKATDTVVIRMYGARDENSELQELETRTFPEPSAGSAPAPTP